MWEDFSYRKLAALIPNTAKKFLVPGETMGHEENVGGVVRQPRVQVRDMKPKVGRLADFADKNIEQFRDEISRADGEMKDWRERFRSSVREELENAPIDESNNFPRGYRDISRFIEEQDYGYGNFTEDMRLLDYYWPYPNEGDVFG